MVDRLYTDPMLAALYDAAFSARQDFDFYLPLVMSAGSVLDVGCGTGELLHRARRAGHAGRLCGVDPAPAMLDLARTRSDIEWVVGGSGSMSWRHEFDLVLMTGHAFQVLVDDRERHASLVAIRSALTGSGRFGFETRNPAAQAWRSWTPDQAREIVDTTGGVVKFWRDVETVDGDLVRFRLVFTSERWDQPQVSRHIARFLGPEAVAAALADAGLAIEEQYGDWDRQPLTVTSPEIITIARRR